MPQAPRTFRPSRPSAPTLRLAQGPDHRKGSARARGYDTRWDKARRGYLASHPLCVCCDAQGVPHPATVVDHVEPHRGDKGKFWQSANWQALCAWCHDNVKQAIEIAWGTGRAGAGELKLARTGVAGWVHPRAR